MMRTSLSILFILAVSVADFGCNVDNAEPATTDGDADGDKDKGGEADGDTDVDSDADTDGDTDTDGDGDTDNDADSDGDTDGDSEKEIEDTAFVTDKPWDSDIYHDTATNTEPVDVGPPDGGFNDADWDAGPCADWALNIQVNPSRIMLLQDVSSSMREGEPMKWVQARSALISLMGTFGFTELLEFGFDVFPDTRDCYADEPLVIDSAPNNGQSIFDILTLIELSQSTPLFMAMGNFLDDSYAPVFTSGDYPSYLIIVSDGKDTCGDETGHFPDGNYGANAAQLGTRTRTLLEQQKVATIAIGFGDDADPEQLNAIAQNGGTNYDRYIPANNRTELEAIFQELAAYTITCEFDLNPVMTGSNSNMVVDYDNIEFLMNGVRLAKDPGCSQEIGWDWVIAKETVRLCNEPCQGLRDNGSANLTADFSCQLEGDII